MSYFRQTIKESAEYFLGQALVMMVSFISLPIITRMLTKEEYGLMTLVNITLSLVGSIACIGIPQAVTSLYSAHPRQD